MVSYKDKNYRKIRSQVLYCFKYLNANGILSLLKKWIRYLIDLKEDNSLEDSLEDVLIEICVLKLRKKGKTEAR